MSSSYIGHTSSFLSTESSSSTENQHDSSVSSENHHVIPGEVLTTDIDFMPGHGTLVLDGKLIATLSGTVHKINKLISVKPLKMRYTGDIGDVLVGRVLEVGAKRWKVDVNARQDAVLLLNAITLPGGIQRRRTNLDELNMRSFFVENDLISCEVQQFYADGAMALYTRSLKYGKLEGGQFLTVPQSLIKRTKNHFHHLPCGVTVILGNNGYIWIEPTKEKQSEIQDSIIPHIEAVEKPEKKAARDVPYHVREKVCRVRNSILALAHCKILIHRDSLLATYDSSISIPVGKMMVPEVMKEITLHAAEGQYLGLDNEF